MALLLASCTTMRTRTFDYDYMYISKTGIIQRPLISDLEVGKQKMKISRKYKNISLKLAKENVMGEFIQEHNCDLIVQPYFTTETINYETTVTVIGYPASFKNIRQFDAKDTIYLLPRANFKLDESGPRISAPEEPGKKKKMLL